MRIRRLVIAGFGPYKGEQTVDFDSFRDDGLFLITGKTGAGKSSILDAVCYALYGSIPRFDGAQPKLRSDYCAPEDPTFVELEFTINTVDYRVRRAPDYERPKRSGTGTTINKGTAELSRLVAGEWQAFAVGPRVVALELEGILSLTKDQFLQVILLAQNRFQEFLLAKNDERQAVLRSLFGTSRFEQIEAALVEKHKALKGRLESSRNSIAQQAVLAGNLAGIPSEEIPAAPDLAWFQSALEEVDAELAAAEAESERTDERFTALDSAHRGLVETQRAQQRRDAARAKAQDLAAARPMIDADRNALAAARKAAAVWPQLTAHQDAVEAVAAAVSAEQAARRDYAAYSEAAATLALDELTAVIDDLARTLGSLDAVLTDELDVPALDATISALDAVVAAREADLLEAGTRAEALPAQIDEATARLGEAQLGSAAEPEAAARVDRIAAARDAASLAAALETQLTDAVRAETTASGEHAAAATRVHQLMEQRLSGHAAELAGTLVDGQPCAVCGSTAHPAPAASTAAPVTQEDIDAARADADARAATFAEATTAAQALATQLAQAQTAAGGRTTEALENELEEARAALRESREATAAVPALQVEVAALRAELDDFQARMTTLRQERDDAVRQLVEQQTTRTAILTRVDTHRAGYDSVAERVDQLQSHKDAALHLSAAIARVASRQDALEAAAIALSAQLAEQGFADDEAVRGARRSAGEMATLEGRIQKHDESTAIVQATLDDPDLAGLPENPIEITLSAQTLDDARQQRDSALAVSSTVAERRRQLLRIVAVVRTEHAASGPLHQELLQLGELASVVQGKEPNSKRMRLETYVLAAQLEEIVAAANTRLRIMTSGRYALQHDDSVQFRNTQSGLGLAILDQHTGRARATQSLSGGETFLASLALALGLAEVVTQQAGGITLDTLFIDEGFGSLDSGTLEIAMGTLDSLRSGGRTIGLISHVDAMKEQIPAKLRITVTPHGYSEIEPSFELV